MLLSTHTIYVDTRSCYSAFMKRHSVLLPLFLLVPLSCVAQAPAEKPAAKEPSLPVINEGVCPGEGCSFRKWIVNRDSTIYSSWKEDRKPLAALKKGQVVTGQTGVHITYAPDRIQVTNPIPDLQLQPGDIILRYMSGGEGAADIWVKGQWQHMYDCSFVTEMDGSGCIRECFAKVIANGKSDWWAQVKTAQGTVGWARYDAQFDCIDSLGGDSKYDKINN